tara:strand:+ start:339 stop:1154 length:816 start_codon:yes stop_codon:yes gene_type:complete
MATYAIGDIQGCYDSLIMALKKISFDKNKDQIYFVGDLVNRGEKSLETLRFIKNLGSAANVVLGNHDLHLLAQFFKENRDNSKKDTLQEIFDAPDKKDLIDWLRHQPLFNYDKEKNIAFVHAGIFPLWTIEDTKAYAKEVESVLRGNNYLAFLLNMYGDQPNSWSEKLEGINRLRFITNSLTRIRFCRPNADLDFKEKMSPVNQKDINLIPWFKHPKRVQKNTKIIFGHWSTLGYFQGDNVWGIDSGCAWGGSLTIIKIGSKKIIPIFVKC